MSRFTLPLRSRQSPLLYIPTEPIDPEEPLIDEILAPADIIVTNAATLTAALNGVASNLNRRYIIGMQGGNYGNFTYPANYNKGTTLVRIRSENRFSPAIFTSISANNSRNIEITRLTVDRNQLDQFGYPTGGACIDIDDSEGTNGYYCLIRDVLCEPSTYGILAYNTKRIIYEYNTIRGFSVDGMRVYGQGNDECADSIIRRSIITATHPTRTYPDVSATVGYAHTINSAIDVRRSDQKSGDENVLNLDGVPILVTQATKDGRHADCIQGAGRWRNMLIEDCFLETHNGYCHGFLHQNRTTDSTTYSSGEIVRGCLIVGAHNHAINVTRSTNPLVEGCWIRSWPGRNWANFWVTPANQGEAIMRPGISTREVDQGGTGSRFQIINTVVPATVATYWMQAATYNATNLVFSDSAQPANWAAGLVAQGRIGQYGHLVP